MTSSNGNIFRVTGHLCGGFTGPDEFPTQRRVTRSFDVFFDLRLNNRLSKQSWGWWFETLSRPLWRHCNERAKLFTKQVCSYVINTTTSSGTNIEFNNKTMVFCKDHSRHGLSQCETLQCNVVSHWLSLEPEWSPLCMLCTNHSSVCLLSWKCRAQIM